MNPVRLHAGIFRAAIDPRHGLSLPRLQGVEAGSAEEGFVIRAMRPLHPVSLLLEHPRTLLDSVPILARWGDLGFGIKDALVAELAANHVVENRWDALRELLELPPRSSRYVHPSCFLPAPSHAHAIARLPALPPGEHTPALEHIMLTRYPDAPFVSAHDFMFALQIAGRDRERALAAIRAYTGTMPLHYHRLGLTWERDALARHGTSADAQRRAALAALLTVEEHLTAHYRYEINDGVVRTHLLAAYAAAREPEHVERHWRWLTAATDKTLLGPHVIDSLLAVASSMSEMVALWDDASASSRKFKRADTRSALVLHHARLGGLGAAREFFGFPPSHMEKDAHWAVLVREAEVTGEQSPETESFRALSAAGMDWNGIAYMLSPFSPYTKLLHRFTRMPEIYGYAAAVENSS